MLKKAIVCTTIFLSSIILSGQTTPKHDRLLEVIIFYESSYSSEAINRTEEAVGILQIRPVMLNEVNKICRIIKIPNRYTLEDRKNPIKSIEMWYIVQGYHNSTYHIRTACLVWNGRGKDGQGNIKYYEKIMSMYADNKKYSRKVPIHTPTWNSDTLVFNNYLFNLAGSVRGAAVTQNIKVGK